MLEPLKLNALYLHAVYTVYTHRRSAARCWTLPCMDSLDSPTLHGASYACMMAAAGASSCMEPDDGGSMTW